VGGTITDQLGELIGQGRQAEVYAWGECQVLKLFFPSEPRTALEVEAGAGRVANEAGVPTPAVGEIIELDGRLGIVFERISGPSLSSELVRHPWRLRRAARQMAELQASIHACKTPELIPLKGETQLWIEGADADASVKEFVLRHLERQPDGDSLCHGDFHDGNVIMSPRGPMIIDWPCGRRGDPLADVARTWLLMRMGGIEPLEGFWGRLLLLVLRPLLAILRPIYYGYYIKHYRQLRPFRDEELAAWKLPMVALRLLRDGHHILPEERERMTDYIKRAIKKQ
jgi:uncharacterized protein (TIGR02172 family)